MRRTTDKHSPRRDEQLGREEHALLHGAPDEGRTEPRRGEASGREEPGPGTRPEATEDSRGAPSQTEVEDRAALAATFRPASFPARREQLIHEAQAHYADEDLITALSRIPDRIYRDVFATRHSSTPTSRSSWR